MGKSRKLKVVSKFTAAQGTAHTKLPEHITTQEQQNLSLILNMGIPE